jgi:hypothetical protein
MPTSNPSPPRPSFYKFNNGPLNHSSTRTLEKNYDSAESSKKSRS